jgi:hypothetical protein
LSKNLSSQLNANGFLKSKMQKLETQVLKSRFSYNNLTEREITFYNGLTMQLFLCVLTKVSICAKLCVKTISSITGINEISFEFVE